MSEQNKAVVRRFLEEILNKKNLAAIDELVSPDFIDHAVPPGAPQGISGARQSLGMWIGAFPDLHVTVQDLIADGDRVAVRLAFNGTHKGEIMGIAPTGKKVAAEGIEVERIANGKYAERWEVFDMLSVMQQLGVVPSGPARR
ncbi:MAG: ester cyclase [Chloroflexi bacterium]|nr:ester cyclase [Chloroflexota bacterium]